MYWLIVVAGVLLGALVSNKTHNDFVGITIGLFVVVVVAPLFDRNA